MKNWGFLIFLILFFCGMDVRSAQIVYPKSQNVIINSPTTFFIGNESPDANLTVNGEKVKLHKSGGFYHPVDLNVGENIFVIEDEHGRSEYKIFRNDKKDSGKSAKFMPYSEPKLFVLSGVNVALRATPEDFGINRLQHYSDKLVFNVIGEENGFYKVKLARDDYAYIKKEYLKPCDCADISPADILNYTYSEDEKSRIYTVKLSKKVPYVLSETRLFRLDSEGYEPYADGYDLVIYNVSGYPEEKYNFHINSAGRSFGFKSYYSTANELVIEIKKFPIINSKKPLTGLKITVDAGHGGSEFGAIGCLGNPEKDINLAIAKKLKPLLEKAGAKVYMTRSDDKDLSLQDRVKISQNNKSDVFVSIHNNALPDSAAKSGRKGTSAYYFYTQSAELAKILKNTLVYELSTADDKVRQESFAVVRNSESLAVLIEVAYMINPEDNAKLVDDAFQTKAAEAILHGLEKYFNVQQ